MAHNTQQNGPQVVYVKEKHGCLMTVVTYLLFGWIGLAVVALWKVTKWLWHIGVAVPARWTWVATVALCKWSWLGCVALVQMSVRAVQGLRTHAD